MYNDEDTINKVVYGEHTLARVPEKHPVFTAKDCKLNGEPIDDATLANINEHFSHFCKPSGEGNHCIKCDQPQGGFLGVFEWGIAHGHGRCSNCGWPATAYHFIKNSTGKEYRIVMVLQAHPDGVTKRKANPL